MGLPFTLRGMLGDEMADAVDAARVRCKDDTVMARCEAARWVVERADAAVAEDLSYEACLAALAALKK